MNKYLHQIVPILSIIGTKAQDDVTTDITSINTRVTNVESSVSTL